MNKSIQLLVNARKLALTNHLKTNANEILSAQDHLERAKFAKESMEQELREIEEFLKENSR